MAVVLIGRNYMITWPNYIIMICYILTVISSLYGGCYNLIKKKISKFGFDRFIIGFFGIFIKDAYYRVSKNPVGIKRMGFALLILGLYGLLKFPSTFNIFP
jgi:hypothetical protein